MSSEEDRLQREEERLQVLQRDAFYDVLHAFKAESLALSDARLTIMDDLRKEWNITQEMRTNFKRVLESEQLVQYLMRKANEKKRRLSAITEEERLQILQSEEERLQREAYYDVLHAFKAESLQLSEARITIIKDLIKEWNITDEYRANFENILEYQPLVQHLKRKANERKRKLGAITEKSTSEYSPESLIGRCVHIRLSAEGEYIPFHIKTYDPEEKTHHLVAAFSPTDYEDPCNWIDIGHLPSEDVIWPGELPGFPAKKRSRKPGETILLATSTVLNKKPLKEYGKSARGIPILSKPENRKPSAAERGKAIALDPEDNANPTIYIPASGSSWDRGAAESLIGKHLCLRLLGEDDEEEFVITSYDAEKEVHYIESTDPNAMEMDELLSQIDLREIPPRDIEWKDVRTARRSLF